MTMNREAAWGKWWSEKGNVFSAHPQEFFNAGWDTALEVAENLSSGECITPSAFMSCYVETALASMATTTNQGEQQ